MTMMITIYPNITETKEGYTISVDTALERIKNGKSKQLLAEIRAAKTKKEKNALKANLPSVIFAGVFKERKDDALVSASGFMVLDFDDVDPDAKKKELANSKYIYACWESPSATGVKALIKIGDPKKFQEYFKAAEQEFTDVDPSGKNISRVCYESYDPKIYINKDAKLFDKLPSHTYNVKNWESVNRALRKIEDAVDGEKHNVRIKIAYLFGGWVSGGELSYEDAHKLLTQAALKNTTDPSAALKDIEDSIRNGMSKPCTMGEQQDILNMRVGIGKLWVTMEDVADEVLEFQKSGYQKGESTGFSSIDENISFIKGATTYIYASPYSGKSNLTHEFCMNLSQSKGWKWVMLTPETGTPAQAYGELMSIYSRQSFVEGGTQDQEAARFVRDHFYIIDTEGKEFYLKDFYTQVEAIERELNVKIDGTVIDPHNYLDFDLSLREDRAIGKDLDLMLADARTKDRHNILVTHVRDQQLRFVKDRAGNIEASYYPMASPREIQYGQIFFRKGMQMLSVWRPLSVDGKPLRNDSGYEYDINETHIGVQKSKPKGIGKTGIVKLWYDAKKNRYYEKASNGEPSYAFGKVEEQNHPDRFTESYHQREEDPLEYVPKE